MFFTLGERQWTTVVEEPIHIASITTYQGGFCFIEDHIKFKFIELNSSLGIIIKDLSSNYPTPDIGAYQFLVVSFCGDLLLVQLNLDINIKIYKMDWKTKNFN
jgi:hypothetical protein